MLRFFSFLPCLLCALCIAPAAQSTTISIRVQHALTGAPVENVTVYCAESKEHTRTLADGYTAVLRVPFQHTAARGVGSCTLVLLCDGFVPCVCTVMTHEGKLRDGIALSLYPDDGTMQAIPSIVEALPQDALASLVASAREHTKTS